MLLLYADEKDLSDEFKNRWSNMKQLARKYLSETDRAVLNYVKRHDRTKSLTDTPLKFNNFLTASFVRHQQSARSENRRNLRSRSGKVHDLFLYKIIRKKLLVNKRIQNYYFLSVEISFTSIFISRVKNIQYVTFLLLFFRFG